MRIVFDPAKSGRNEERRGLAFSEAERLDWAAALIVEDVRFDYGERRYRAIAPLDGVPHVVVFTPRRGEIRVISLRRANRKERRIYGEARTQASNDD